MPRNSELIEQILQEDDASDPRESESLQAKARRRAESGEVPRTMTPWEWEDYYQMYGRPEQHQPPREKTESVFSRIWKAFHRLLAARQNGSDSDD